jgi:2-keto-4-pentenoate hydratase/2-oxohepta-3-ene-1,7-dioic acid hydratase in catechol pathway
MKLIRFGESGKEKPGILLNSGKMIDVSEFTSDFDSPFLSSGGIEELRTWISSNEYNCPIVSNSERLGPPVSQISKIVCVGLNYAQHAKESGMEVPKEPVLFFKATSAICGPNDNVVIPKGSEKTDWEVELGVVIGKKASYVSEENAMSYVAGYVLHNDYSERAFQLERSGQWVKGKSCDTFAPLGPFMATQDEIPDPHKLRLWLKVNDKMMQDSNTSDLVFGIPHLVGYISEYMTLRPGDVISTGTPFGVGLGLTPPTYLAPGDEVELGIDGLGISKQKAVKYPG